MVVGAWCEGIGLALRLGVRQNLHSKGLYIAQYLFVVLSVSSYHRSALLRFPQTNARSPALSLLVSYKWARYVPRETDPKGDYILLGRIVSYFDASAYLKPLKPQWVSWTFIISDSTYTAHPHGTTVIHGPKADLQSLHS